MLPELLLQQFDQDKNPFDIKTLPQKPSQKIWWIDNLKHSWSTRLSDRYRSGKISNCPYCSGKKILSGFNDLETRQPIIAAQWHNFMNANLKPSDVSPKSNKNVWWQCEYRHEWKTSINNRTDKNSGCPYCAGQKSIPGLTDLTVTHPDLAAQIHPFKNNNLLIENILPGSNKKIWWIDQHNHEWEASPNNRIRGRGCPVCNGHLVVIGINDFLTTHPKIAAEWNFDKNTFSPDAVTAGSHKKAWWIGSCHHEWECSVKQRVKGSSCPYCSGHKKSLGFNDLVTTHPRVSKEWDYEVNGMLLPENVSKGSEVKVGWVCNQGHKWKASVYARTNKSHPTGCPICWQALAISKPEKELVDFCEKLGFKVITSDRKILKGLEIDIYLPEVQVGIEFNGLYWHSESLGKDKFYHLNKWEMAQHAGIELIFIWEDEWLKNSSRIEKILAQRLTSYSSPASTLNKNSPFNLKKSLALNFLDADNTGLNNLAKQYIGLNGPTGELNAVLSFEYIADEIVISNYFSLEFSQDSLKKILSYLVKVYRPRKIIGFSDKGAIDNRLFLKQNFDKVEELPPKCSYIVKGKRVATAVSEESKESSRIWDAGSTKWMKELR